VVSALFKRLGAGSSQLQEAVESALADLYRDELASFVDRGLAAERPATVAAAVRVLERMADPRAATLLEHMLRARDPEVRAASVRALASTAPDSAARSLHSMLEDPNELVRVAAFEVLAASGLDALPRLLKAGSDPAVAVRRRLCQVLAGFDYQLVAPVLQKLCDDTSGRVSASALISLASFANADTLPLMAALCSAASAERVQELRSDACVQSVSHKLGRLLSSGGDATLREAALQIIVTLGCRGHELLLLPVLRDPNSRLRQLAAQALSGSDVPEVQEQLAELNDDPDPAVREAARVLRRAG
jgi:HEAT repeat protein